ncbi:MAG: hypothetical protein BEN19_03030 [Epulopiscium sp. Nuni2H_MBin003]|nr:MAG: hypothetical protein BEN19_03030 [Epulopiscium sp. Nuni2H_MBin003]
MRFGFIGGGNIVRAILTGINKGGEFKNHDIGIFDIDKNILTTYSNQGYNTYNSIEELTQNSDVVVIAVTPQIIRSITDELKLAKDNVIISLVAGITLDWLTKNVGDFKLFRCMPTLAAQEGLGSFAISYSNKVANHEKNIVAEFFGSCGVVEYIDESLMSKVVAINGSAPGYFYYISRIVEDVAIKMGFEADVARRLFAQTMKGSAETILKSELSLKDLEGKIKVHGGTTSAALDAMEQEGLYKCIEEGLLACVKRSEELGKL